MMNELSFYSDGANRLDKQIAENSELTRSAAVKLIEQGLVIVDGKAMFVYQQSWCQRSVIPEVCY